MTLDDLRTTWLGAAHEELVGSPAFADRAAQGVVVPAPKAQQSLAATQPPMSCPTSPTTRPE